MKLEESVEILNKYRNSYYNYDSSSEEGLVASALNVLLPEYMELKDECEMLRLELESILSTIKGETE